MAVADDTVYESFFLNIILLDGLSTVPGTRTAHGSALSYDVGKFMFAGAVAYASSAHVRSIFCCYVGVFY